MSFTTILIASVILLAIFFVITKLAIRWAIRLTILGLILVAVLGAIVFWSWSNSLTKRQPNKPRATPTRRG